jgi:hypothetical protein
MPPITCIDSFEAIQPAWLQAYFAIATSCASGRPCAPLTAAR